MPKCGGVTPVRPRVFTGARLMLVYIFFSWHGANFYFFVLVNQIGGVGRGGRRRKRRVARQEEEELYPPGQRFKITSVGSRYFFRFKAIARKTKFRIFPPPQGYDHLRWLEGGVRRIKIGVASRMHVGRASARQR